MGDWYDASEPHMRIPPTLRPSDAFGLQEEVARLTAENARLRELVHHCWIHSGYKDCGSNHMARDMRSLFEETIADAAAALTPADAGKEKR